VAVVLVRALGAARRVEFVRVHPRPHNVRRDLPRLNRQITTADSQRPSGYRSIDFADFTADRCARRGRARSACPSRGSTVARAVDAIEMSGGICEHRTCVQCVQSVHEMVTY
jgi:hypothetical protein